MCATPRTCSGQRVDATVVPVVVAWQKEPVQEAVDKLLEQHVCKYCGPDICHDRNSFR